MSDTTKKKTKTFEEKLSTRVEQKILNKISNQIVSPKKKKENNSSFFSNVVIDENDVQ